MLYELYHIIIFLIECTHPLVLKSLTPAGDIVVKVMLQARVLWAALSLDLHARIKTVGARTSSSPSGCSRSTFRSILCMACQCELSLTTTRRQRWSSEAALPSIQEFVDTMLMVASGSYKCSLINLSQHSSCSSLQCCTSSIPFLLLLVVWNTRICKRGLERLPVYIEKFSTGI